jgi:hypothetical protein
VAGRTPRGASTFPGGWTRIVVDAGRVIWLRAGATGGPLVVAASDGRWNVTYTRTNASWPTAIRLRRTEQGQLLTDAVFEVDAPEAMASLPDGALEVTVPGGAREVTVVQLRNSRELRQR